MDTTMIEAGLDRRKADLVIKNGSLVNVLTEEVYPADVAIYGSRIAAVGNVSNYIGHGTKILDADQKYLVPGLIDGHIHVECSKLSITMFAKAVLAYGTTSIISGLDQIFVVAGLEGVRDFLDESKLTPLKIFWGAPCKLPYTIPPSTVAHNFLPRHHRIGQSWPECVGIWETVKEFVLEHDESVHSAIKLAAEHRLLTFGCAPMTQGPALSGYLCAGIRADHECYSQSETLEKLRNGMWVMLRESSVAHFLKENIKVITQDRVASRRVGFCTDDVTAHDILRDGHLDRLVRLAIQEGVDPLKAIQLATINCAELYRIDHLVGSIAPGRTADILLVDKPETFNVEEVIANGKFVAANHRTIIDLRPPKRKTRLSRTFRVPLVKTMELEYRTKLPSAHARVLSMKMSEDVPFVRKRHDVLLRVQKGVIQPDIDQDALYVTVVERFGKTRHKPLAFISGFKLQGGAMASSASPDDNNILCIGTTSGDMACAINHIIRERGGQVVVSDLKVQEFLPLPIGGIVADLDPEKMAEQESRLDNAARVLGCRFKSPFMYMIFLSITAIPDYAITDRGLVDCVNLRIISPILGPG